VTPRVLWSRAIGLSESIDDIKHDVSFVAAGGDSLSAARLCADVLRRFDAVLSVAEVLSCTGLTSFEQLVSRAIVDTSADTPAVEVGVARFVYD
jgi:acyl carrier protein